MLPLKNCFRKVNFSIYLVNFSIYLMSSLCLLCINTPETPYQSKNTSIKLILESSDKKTDEFMLADSTGKTFRVGITSNLPQYIDSVRVSIFYNSTNLIDKDTILRRNITIDTQWCCFTLDTTGARSIIARAFIHDDRIFADTASISIFKRPDNVGNRAPKWGKDTIVQTGLIGSTIKFDLEDKCNDPDNDTMEFILLTGAPLKDSIINNSYTFPASSSDTGTFFPKILARDNRGESDTLTVKLVILIMDITQPKLFLVSPASDSLKISSNVCQLKIKCVDESGILAVKCSMGTDSFQVYKADNICLTTVTGLKADHINNITFIATDASPAGNRDSLIVHVIYDSTITDNVGPIFSKVSGPSVNSVVVDSNLALVYTIEDNSGVDSVYWTLNGVRQGFLLTAIPSNQYTLLGKLYVPHMNWITIQAQDKSSNHNRNSIEIVLNYNHPPIAISCDTLQSQRAVSRSITLLASDIENDTIKQWKIVNGPFNGTITNTRPTFTYTPNGDYTGQDSLFFRVWDSSDSSNAGKINIVVNARDIAPVILTHPIAASRDKGASATFTVAINSEVYPTPQFFWIKDGKDTISKSGATFKIDNLQYSNEGSYKVLVRNRAGDDASNAVSLIVRDITIPTITLNGPSDTTVLFNSSWADPGTTIKDDRDSLIPESSVIKTGTYSTSSVGRYEILYNFTDAGGNKASTKIRILRVEGWEKVGEIANGELRGSVLSIDSIFYIAYYDNTDNLNKVMTINNFNLVALGLPGNIGGTYSISLALGNDGKTPFITTYPLFAKWNGTAWLPIGEELNLSGGSNLSLILGPNNKPFLAANFWQSDGHGESCPYDVLTFGNDTWNQVCQRYNPAPLSPSNGIYDKNFCVTESGDLYVGNISEGNGVMCKKLSNSLTWINAANDSFVERSNQPISSLHVLSDVNDVFIGFNHDNNLDNPVIYKLNSSIWSKLPSLPNAAYSGGGLSMAFAPNHQVYSAYAFGGGIVVYSYDGSGWINVPSILRGVTFPADCKGISIAPGSNECYASYTEQSTGKIKIMHWKRQ